MLFIDKRTSSSMENFNGFKNGNALLHGNINDEPFYLEQRTSFQGNNAQNVKQDAAINQQHYVEMTSALQSKYW